MGSLVFYSSGDRYSAAVIFYANAAVDGPGSPIMDARILFSGNPACRTHLFTGSAADSEHLAKGQAIKTASRAIRRIGEYFEHQLHDLSEQPLLDYFTKLLSTHSWMRLSSICMGLSFSIGMSCINTGRMSI